MHPSERPPTMGTRAGTSASHRAARERKLTSRTERTSVRHSVVRPLAQGAGHAPVPWGRGDARQRPAPDSEIRPSPSWRGPFSYNGIGHDAHGSRAARPPPRPQGERKESGPPPVGRGGACPPENNMPTSRHGTTRCINCPRRPRPSGGPKGCVPRGFSCTLAAVSPPRLSHGSA